jgi:16S rRNA (guanine966-N2)-methyltransferase
MAVKILSGKFRGFPLETPRGDTTKPTSVLVKRRLFDWRQNLEGYYFIDLCAGSGAMGLEALSRGAEKVFLNDSMRGAFLTLKQNKEKMISAFKVEDSEIVVTNAEALKWISKELSYQISNFDDCILFFDPPYADHALYLDGLKALKEMGYTGEVWVESDRLAGPKLETLSGSFSSIIKTIEHGDHFVIVGKVG